MRLIDADALIVEFNKRCRGECCCCTEDYCGSGNDGCGCRVIDDAPTVDPVKHGHWKEIDRGLLWQCSECEHYSVSGGDYCEWCGAKMDEVSDEINN